MKKLVKIRGRRKLQETDDRTPLIEKNNKDMSSVHNQAGDGYHNCSAQNTLNSHMEQNLENETKIHPQELAELLGVADDANDSEDGCFCSVRSETNSEQQNLSVLLLIKRSVNKHFPKPPADLEKNLQEYLLDVQGTLQRELLRLCPLFDQMGLMGCLIDCYHRQTFSHLNVLLQDTHSFQNSFLLMNWVLRTYLSKELLNHPDLQEMEPVTKVDLLLLTEWVEKAKQQMLKNVQEEVSGFLEQILQLESKQEDFNGEEACVRLYVDTIQCIEAMPTCGQTISSKLSDQIREVCFQALLTFLRRYTTEQTEILKENAEKDKPETIHFLKVLNNCKKLKQHVQTKRKGISKSLFQETVAMLEKMEAFTLKLLLEIVTDIAESHLKKYFRSENRHFLSLIGGVQTDFPKLLRCEDVQKIVMDKVYKCIAHIYLKNLIQRSQSKLTKCWSSNVGQRVTEDAELLHITISSLAPGVKQWNFMLLRVQELLECKCTDSVKLTVAIPQKERPTWSEDLELLPALLRWKGLSRREVQEVLCAIPGQNDRLTSTAWHSCFACFGKF